MPLENALFLGLVLSAFTIFGLTLAYANWTTSHRH
jgi:hypothetical protein